MVRAHSDLEIALDIMLADCECGGDVEQVGQALAFEDSIPCAVVRVRCEQCGAEAERQYDISAFHQQDEADHEPLNPTDHPSELLDIVQFVHLAQFYLEQVQENSTETKIDDARRYLGIAACCIEEAIKHLRGAKSPPPEAVFSSDRQLVLQTNLEVFGRENLQEFEEEILEFADKLPAIYDIIAQLTGDPKKDEETLARLAKQFQNDKILTLQIERIAESVLPETEEKEEEDQHTH